MADTTPVNATDFSRLCEFLYRRTGMVFTEARRNYIERRINERMRSTDSQSFNSYFAWGRSDASAELKQLINELTVNETYFYRESHQLRCLTNDLLADRIRRAARSKTIRIWSLPCS